MLLLVRRRLKVTTTEMPPRVRKCQVEATLLSLLEALSQTRQECRVYIGHPVILQLFACFPATRLLVAAYAVASSAATESRRYESQPLLRFFVWAATFV